MDLIHQEKPEHFALSQVTSENHDIAIHVIKRYFLSEHVLVRSRNMDISNDCALDEYLISLLKQGNSLFAKAEDGTVAGLCVSFASSPVDPKNLRNYAFYRQCLVKFPLHKVRGANAPFIKRSSEFNRCVRVYVEARSLPDVDRTTVRSRQQDLESLIE
ncbi:hypothetical protein B5X24_HaOG205689 [Helicoverpa armigera]|uniref:Uncharacterized protein n=1 Tax=Helicoverpa armigera TaxID=29058 RepID=A0A2W1BQ70_HELAM|nr:hypothetical protein B5X24_HaOG205689 [Helicoverpa armigera]